MCSSLESIEEWRIKFNLKLQKRVQFGSLLYSNCRCKSSRCGACFAKLMDASRCGGVNPADGMTVNVDEPIPGDAFIDVENAIPVDAMQVDDQEV
jgi:hypothetical protein